MLKPIQLLRAQASFTVFDPDGSWDYNENSNLSKSINSPWLNWSLKGKVKAVIKDNRIKKKLINAKLDLSIIIPAFNEVQSIPQLYNLITDKLSEKPLSYEVIFIDDGSNDDTWKEMEKKLLFLIKK